MEKDTLEYEIYTNLIDHDSNSKRNFLSKIKP